MTTEAGNVPQPSETLANKQQEKVGMAADAAQRLAESIFGQVTPEETSSRDSDKQVGEDIDFVRSFESGKLGENVSMDIRYDNKDGSNVLEPIHEISFNDLNKRIDAYNKGESDELGKLFEGYTIDAPNKLSHFVKFTSKNGDEIKLQAQPQHEYPEEKIINVVSVNIKNKKIGGNIDYKIKPNSETDKLVDSTVSKYEQRYDNSKGIRSSISFDDKRNYSLSFTQDKQPNNPFSYSFQLGRYLNQDQDKPMLSRGNLRGAISIKYGEKSARFTFDHSTGAFKYDGGEDLDPQFIVNNMPEPLRNLFGEGNLDPNNLVLKDAIEEVPGKLFDDSEKWKFDSAKDKLKLNNEDAIARLINESLGESVLNSQLSRNDNVLSTNNLSIDLRKSSEEIIINMNNLAFKIALDSGDRRKIRIYLLDYNQASGEKSSSFEVSVDSNLKPIEGTNPYLTNDKLMMAMKLQRFLGVKKTGIINKVYNSDQIMASARGLIRKAFENPDKLVEDFEAVQAA